ncbi:MAG: His/Gly/Thr/Pro-type tRNA ligase C-terminal domain-containing protein, partial [Candidatus Sumerlaeota bacterium]|nr:His/Gly/Thr/Pro-type tRNA ligase C-terminal domain-containing protein [Candidatus Sumerlaeota bacterium]
QQLSYANSKGIPIAVIAGGDELAAGQVSIKDLREGMQAREAIADHEAYRQAGKAGQQTIARTEMVASIKKLLAKKE